MAGESVSWFSRVKYMGLGALIFALILLLLFMFVPQLSTGFIAHACGTENCEHDSVLEIAAQVGRLDVVSLVLGVLGIGVGAFAIFGFFAIRDHAEAVSERVARDVAEETASRKVDQYMSANGYESWGRPNEKSMFKDFLYLTKSSQRAGSAGDGDEQN